MKDSFIEIIPSLLGFTFAIIPLIYFIFFKNIKGIIIASFTFLFSGFSIQILIKYSELIRIFANKYHNIFSFPLVTVIGTAIGIFTGNKMLRFFLDGKERKEISILLTSSIRAQTTNLGFIDRYTSIDRKIDDTNYIEIYQSEFDSDEPFKVAFNRIGIYKESEIELISDYYIDLKQCLNYVKRFLLESKRSHNSIINIYRIVTISIALTQIQGMFCIYIFSANYSNLNKDKLREEFLNTYHKIIIKLRQEFKPSYFSILDTNHSQDIIKRLKQIRTRYKKLAKLDYSLRIQNQDSIYLSRVSLDKEYSEQRVDRETGNISFHTFIKKNNDIVAFGNSEEESIEQCKQLIKDTLKSLLSNQEIDDLIQKQRFESHIVSPWG